MPDKPSRSVFVPLLIVTVVLAIGLFAILVPISTCERCNGLEIVIFESSQSVMLTAPQKILSGYAVCVMERAKSPS